MGNIPLATVALYVLVLPGLLLQGGYCRGGLFLIRNRQNSSVFPSRKHPTYPKSARGLAEEFLKGILSALCLHLVWGLIAVAIYKPIDYVLVYEILNGKASSSDMRAVMSKDGPFVLFYFVSIIAVPPIVGRWTLFFVRKKRFDHLYKLFRFNDPWYYLIRGEIWDLPELSGSKKPSEDEFEAVVVVAIVNGAKRIAYSGYIREWELSRTRGLDRLILEDAVWSFVDEQSGDFGKPIELPGKLLSLNCAEVESLAFHYVGRKKPKTASLIKLPDPKSSGQ